MYIVDYSLFLSISAANNDAEAVRPGLIATSCDDDDDKGFNLSLKPYLLRITWIHDIVSTRTFPKAINVISVLRASSSLSSSSILFLIVSNLIRSLFLLLSLLSLLLLLPSNLISVSVLLIPWFHCNSAFNRSILPFKKNSITK